MDLQEKLDATKKRFESSAPRESVDIMHRATHDLGESGIMERIVKEGDKAPDFALNDVYGKIVQLKERLARGAVVLGFYRGRW